MCVRTGRPIKHIGAEDGAVCPEGQPRQTGKFFGCFGVFRAPDLVSPAQLLFSSLTASQLKMAFVLQSERTGAGWPVAVTPERRWEALLLLFTTCLTQNRKYDFITKVMKIALDSVRINGIKTHFYSGLYTYKLVIPSQPTQNERRKRVLHRLCSPPTGKPGLTDQDVKMFTCFSLNRRSFINTSIKKKESAYRNLQPRDLSELLQSLF